MQLARRDVLALYKRILRFGQAFESKDPALTAEHRQEILTEAKERFRENVQLSDVKRIGELMDEGRTRMELARHYGIPTARPVYLAPGTAFKKAKGKEAIYRSRPLHER
ncbi:unnamed protein product, partial [Mesorhabditis spiculigera]